MVTFFNFAKALYKECASEQCQVMGAAHDDELSSCNTNYNGTTSTVTYKECVMYCSAFMTLT